MEAIRDCTVTEGQDLLIPISNTICATITGETAEQLLEQCREITDQTRNLQLTIDRNQVQNLEEDNRVTYESLFTVDLPENNLFGLPPDVATSIDAVADGYWAQIEGLSAGEHTIRVIGAIGGPTFHSAVQATYNLTVEGEATDEAATDEEEEALAIDEEVQEEQQPEEEGEGEGNGGDGDIPDEDIPPDDDL